MKLYFMLLAVLMVLVLPAAADIPDPLPDPDTTAPDTTKPVKVFILSGQSNMVGMGNISPLGTPGTLETITKTEGMFPHLIDDEGEWTVRNDVLYRGLITAIGNGLLTPGVMGGSFGPELGFGHVMGYYYDEPVLILKSSQGNRAIGWDFLPPGSVQYDSDDGYTRPGYGGSPERWLIGTTPVPIGWYAGKQYDDCFLDESDWAPAGSSQPATSNVTDVLDNFASQYPQYATQGFEIAGYGWWQGHRDSQGSAHAGRYELNMVNFINELRQYYENRYPDNVNPNAPFVIATIAFSGWEMSGNYLTVINAQLAVSGESGNYPAFEGNVKTVECRDYWREVAESPSNQGHHYNRNAETFMLVGDAMGRAMAEILTPYSVNVGTNMITWSGEPVELDATVQEGVTVVSYAWSADPAAGVLFSDPLSEDTTVTITKATDNPSTVKVTLTVNDGVNPPVPDSIRIDVYDDACKATIGKGLAVDNPTDLNEDCVTGLEDLLEIVSKWLNDTGLTAPIPK